MEIFEYDPVDKKIIIKFIQQLLNKCGAVTGVACAAISEKVIITGPSPLEVEPLEKIGAFVHQNDDQAVVIKFPPKIILPWKYEVSFSIPGTLLAKEINSFLISSGISAEMPELEAYSLQYKYCR